MGLLSILDGASAWWWVALALGLGVVEMMTFTYFILWLALGAMTVAVLLFGAPATTGETQIIVFALSTLGYAVVGWGILKLGRRGGAVPEDGLNRRAARLIGRTAVARSAFSGEIGTVEVDGVSWRARLAAGSPEPAPGQSLRITSAEGMLLIVES